MTWPSDVALLRMECVPDRPDLGDSSYQQCASPSLLEGTTQSPRLIASSTNAVGSESDLPDPSFVASVTTANGTDCRNQLVHREAFLGQKTVGYTEQA